MAQTQVSIQINGEKVNQTFTLPFELEQPKKSGRNVVKLGLILFCLSTCLAVNAITVGVISTQWQTSGITVTCSLLFILLSFLAMYGEGGDSKIDKQILVGCIGLAVLGIGAIIVGIIFNVASWHEVKRFCVTCTQINEPLVNNSIPFYVIAFENSSETLNVSEIETDSIMTSIDYDFTTYSPDDYVVNLTDLTVGSYMSLATYYNSTEISSFNYTESARRPEQAVCNQLCSTWRTSLFLVLIGLLICNSILSIGLSYVIFIIRFRNSEYLAAISV